MSETPEAYEQGSTKKGRKSVKWRRDPFIISRLGQVERRHLAGQNNVAIAAALGVTEGTIRSDLARLSELWQERIQGQQEHLRAVVVRELDDVKRRALDAAEFDEAAERAVLFGQVDTDLLGDDARVHYDSDGRAQFRGNKAAALGVARQALMDRAKVLGLVVDKQEHRGEMLIREYRGVDVDSV